MTQELNLRHLSEQADFLPPSHQGKDALIAAYMTQMVKNPSVMQETWVQSLGCEYALEEGMATHSSILV